MGIGASSVRRHVFVSYSHADYDDDSFPLKDLIDSLRVLVRKHAEKGIKVWFDGHILIGERWEEKLVTAMDETRVAVLLLTPRFADSAFIRERELPYLLDAEERELLLILPFIVQSAPMEKLDARLKKLQYRGTFRAKPWLEADARERSQALEDLGKRIASEFEKPPWSKRIALAFDRWWQRSARIDAEKSYLNAIEEALKKLAKPAGPILPLDVQDLERAEPQLDRRLHTSPEVLPSRRFRWGSRYRNARALQGDRRARSGGNAKPAVERILRAKESLLILGAPGAGKSTLLRDLAQQLAASERARIERSWFWPNPTLVVHIPLGELSAERVALVSGIGLVKQAISRHLGEARYLDEWLNGRLLVLLDGVDEIDPAQRAAWVAELDDFSQTSGARCVITCRPGANPQGLRAQQLWLQPFSNARVGEYLESAGFDRSFARLTATELLRPERWGEAARNPLMLRLIQAFIHKESRIPAGLAELMDGCLEAMCNRGRTSRPDELDALARVAFESERGSIELQVLRELYAEDFETALRAGIAGWLFEPLRATGDHTSMSDAGAVRFSHQVFYHYLCARHLANNPAVEATLDWPLLVLDPHWREVLIDLVLSDAGERGLAALEFVLDDANQHYRWLEDRILEEESHIRDLQARIDRVYPAEAGIDAETRAKLDALEIQINEARLAIANAHWGLHPAAERAWALRVAACMHIAHRSGAHPLAIAFAAEVQTAAIYLAQYGRPPTQRTLIDAAEAAPVELATRVLETTEDSAYAWIRTETKAAIARHSSTRELPVDFARRLARSFAVRSLQEQGRHFWREANTPRQKVTVLWGYALATLYAVASVWLATWFPWKLAERVPAAIWAKVPLASDCVWLGSIPFPVLLVLHAVTVARALGLVLRLSGFIEFCVALATAATWLATFAWTRGFPPPLPHFGVPLDALGVPGLEGVLASFVYTLLGEVAFYFAAAVLLALLQGRAARTVLSELIYARNWTSLFVVVVPLTLATFGIWSYTRPFVGLGRTLLLSVVLGVLVRVVAWLIQPAHAAATQPPPPHAPLHMDDFRELRVLLAIMALPYAASFPVWAWLTRGADVAQGADPAVPVVHWIRGSLLVLVAGYAAHSIFQPVAQARRWLDERRLSLLRSRAERATLTAPAWRQLLESATPSMQAALLEISSASRLGISEHEFVDLLHECERCVRGDSLQIYWDKVARLEAADEVRVTDQRSRAQPRRGCGIAHRFSPGRPSAG